METIRNLYRIGHGPSSSHTMGPRTAVEDFIRLYPHAAAYRVTLYGSLAASGKGHRTDIALQEALAPKPVQILWQPQQVMPRHPNALRLEALDADGSVTGAKLVYSVGGGRIVEDGQPDAPLCVYPISSMSKILEHCERSGQALWEYVAVYEGEQIWDTLRQVWGTMQSAIQEGLEAEGVLPGGLGLARKASALYRKTLLSGEHFRQSGLLSAYALAVAEQNADGGLVVTAPTCGASGVVPAVLRYMQETLQCSDAILLRALATAGLIGVIVKHNASIAGAEVGCQGEIGVACAMAAAAAAQMMGGTVHQVEYAAEMGLEHFLGLTCDPVAGLVQIPCIERNAFAATRAIHSADYALFSDGEHRISFDDVVAVMKQTGHDLPSLYRETASGGLAGVYHQRDGDDIH
jgi:L-serine dehydratase